MGQGKKAWTSNGTWNEEHGTGGVKCEYGMWNKERKREA
jgi:hypothetical protein